ncbi:MAG TPA: diphthine--ammonia ligase [Firmicutes bacterium]|jgi:diphthine-ammonia ligase|nr:diphthine--ammonia ligase [Bacillota bacterium]
MNINIKESLWNRKEGEENAPFFTSWSGGKDSCLAFYRAWQSGLKPQALLTMLIENGERSHAHGLSVEVLSAQANSLGLTLTVQRASWETYEQVFTAALSDLRSQGITVGVFGDIDLKQHKSWVEQVARKAGIQPVFPLWQEERVPARARVEVVKSFLDCGFRAMIVAVKDRILTPDFLGRILDAKLLMELEKRGVDPAGEEGEFHTVVFDGPIFNFPLRLKLKGRLLIDGYWFLDLSLQ